MIAAAGLFLSKFAFGRWLKRIPRSVWIKIGIAVAVLMAVFVLYRIHEGKVQKLVDESYAEGKADAYAAIEQATAGVEAKSVVISTDIRSKTIAENNRTAGRADAVRLRGPGKAAYQCGPVAGGSPGKLVTAGGPADVAMAPVPDRERSDLIVVPFAELVAFAEAHDLNRTDVLAERENRAKQLELIASTNK